MYSTTPTKNLRSEILDFWKRLWDTIWSFLGQYLSLGVKWGLYEHLQVTPRPMRPKLADMRDLFRVMFVPTYLESPGCDNSSEVSVLARSFFCHTETFFAIGWLRKALGIGGYSVWDGKRALVRRNRSKIDLCGPKSVRDILVRSVRGSGGSNFNTVCS